MDLCVHQVALCLLAQNGVRFPVSQSQTAQSMHHIVPMMVLSYDMKKTKMKKSQCVAFGHEGSHIWAQMVSRATDPATMPIAHIWACLICGHMRLDTLYLGIAALGESMLLLCALDL